MTREFYSNGKLLITGEYVVLDGALALAVPTSYGQSLHATLIEEPFIRWVARDHENKVWFEGDFLINGNAIENLPSQSSSAVANRLQHILNEAHQLNPDLLRDNGFEIITRLEFPSSWGLGSSSTLINNIASLFKTDPYKLLEKTFGGSGYDIAAAQNNEPLTYQLKNKERSILTVRLDPDFKDEIFFVHLNRKQDSRKAIEHYRMQSKEKLAEATEKISALTQRFISCTSLNEMELLIEIHETLISQLLNTPKIKTSLFPDYPGAIKSLGGWGGDFVMATGNKDAQEYFIKKGYTTVIPFDKMVKSGSK